MAARNRDAEAFAQAFAEAAPGGRAVITKRMIDAPRALVFEAWTTPAHLGAWFGPDGFTTTTRAFDLRAGGVWRFVMHGPDGTDYQNRVVFEEVTPPERIVYRHDDGGESAVEPVRFVTVVTFEEVAGKTLVTLHGEFPSTAERDRVIRDYGALEGARQNADRLGAYVERLAAAPGGARPIKRVVVVRTLDAPRDLVWSAWTDPDKLMAWWGPTGFTAPRCRLELKVGGAYDVDMQAPDGSTHPVKGVIREIKAPERLVFSAWVHGMDADGAGEGSAETLNAITLEAQGDKTMITVEATVVSAADPALFAGMEHGWAESIEKLAASLG